jgi:hypothetical protein
LYGNHLAASPLGDAIPQAALREVAMQTFRTIRITARCPRCGNQINISTSVDMWLEDPVHSGRCIDIETVFRVFCPDCLHAFEHLRDLTVYSLEHGFKIRFVAHAAGESETALKRRIAAAKSRMRQPRASDPDSHLIHLRRIVTCHEAFKEKARIFAMRLCDKRVELLKYACLINPGAAGGRADLRFHCHKGRPVVHLRCATGSWLFHCGEKILEWLRGRIWMPDSLIVDAEWARRHFGLFCRDKFLRMQADRLFGRFFVPVC